MSTRTIHLVCVLLSPRVCASGQSDRADAAALCRCCGPQRWRAVFSVFRYRTPFRATSDELVTADQNSLCSPPLNVGQHIWVLPALHQLSIFCPLLFVALHMLTHWAYVHVKHSYIKATRTPRRTGTVVGIAVRLSWG